jgi:hypothetical protein
MEMTRRIYRLYRISATELCWLSQVLRCLLAAYCGVSAANVLAPDS